MCGLGRGGQGSFVNASYAERLKLSVAYNHW